MKILGIDVGGTKSILAVADEAGTILSSLRIETPGLMGPDAAIALMKETGHKVIEEAGGVIDIIGIGCGGPLGVETGTLGAVPNLPGWQGLSLTKIFGEEFGAPAYLDNDATAAAIGELMFGAGKGYKNFVYMNSSTGIGGGIIADGKPYRGHNGNAGEFGHQKVEPEGRACPCGDRGCVEALASGTAIAAIASEALVSHPDTVIWQWIDSSEQVTAEMIAKATKQGDPFASEIWYTAMRYFGLGLANVVNILNPERVILGGGVTKAGDIFFEPVRAVVAERAMKALADVVEIVPSGNGDNVGLMGAFGVALEKVRG